MRFNQSSRIRWALLGALGYILSCPQQFLERFIPEARADSISYAYDALGRVVQATDSATGQAVIYHYDAAGNITLQQSVALTTLAFAGTSSNQGAPGTQVVITGTGFSPLPGGDIVTFNGVAATVVSATQTQLVVTVPAGATSGTINVQTGGATVSGGAFTVAASDVAPTVTNFSPALAATGTSIALSGGGFDTTAGNDLVQLGFGGGYTSASSATATTLSVTVPAAVWSGKVQVITAHGEGSSVADFFTPPSGYTVAQIGSTARANLNAPTSVSLPTAGLASLQIFDGNAGDLLTFSATSVSIPSSIVKIFAPTGASFATFTLNANTRAVSLPALPNTGTYAIIFDPGSNTGTLTFNLLSPVQTSISVGAAPTAVSISAPGQPARISFSGAPGSPITLSITNVTLSSSKVTLLDPSGTIVLTATMTTTGLSFEPQLLMAGTYTLMVVPTAGVSGSFQVAATSTATATLRRGQNTLVSLGSGATLTNSFTAMQGQYLTTAFGGVQQQQTTSGSASVSYSVIAPDGSTACSGSFLVQWQNTNFVLQGASCDLVPAKQTGTYLVKLTAPNSVNLFLALSAPATVALDPTQPPVSVPLSIPGQGAFLTFSAPAGQSLSFAVQLTTPISAYITFQNAQISVTRPDALPLQSTPITLGAQGSVVVANFGPLPVSGTYTIFFDPKAATTGTMVFTLSLPLAGGNMPSDNSTTTNTLARQGQAVAKTFSGPIGTPVYFALSAKDSGISSAGLRIVSPSGKTITPALGPTYGYGCSNYSCTPPPSASDPCQPGNTPCDVLGSVFVPPLAEAGTYTALIPQSTNSGYSQAGLGTWSFTSYSVATGNLTPNGPTVTPGSSYLFQMTFAATAGQSYTADVIPPATDPFIAAWLVGPDGTYIATGPPTNGFCTTTCPRTPFGLSTGTVARSGTYTVVVESIINTTFSFQLTSP